MSIREATAQDRDRLRDLYREFVREIPPPPGIPVDIEHELGELDDYLGDQNVALVAEDDAGQVVGFALAKIDHPGIGHLSDLYVMPEARRQGAARELIREAATKLRDEEEAAVLTLGVQVTNEDARTAYERLGFQPESLRLFAPIEHLLKRSERGPRGPSFGSAHVQTDDENAVEQAVRKYVPRFGRSGGSVVAGPPGADPHEFRRVARTAAAPEELGTPQDLLEQIAGLMGLSGVGHGYEGAASEPGAQEIAHR